MIYGSQEFNDVLVQVIRTAYRHPYYETASKLAKDMSVHVYGTKPEELLNRVRPGEDDAIKQYRLDNYEPTTKAPCGKAIKIVSKIFNPNLSSIVFKDNPNAQKLKEYTMEYYPMYNSIVVYNKDVTLKKMIADANALQVVKPSRRPANDAEKVRPVVVIYSSENVWNWDHEHFLVFLSKDKDRDIEWHTFEYIDFEQIIKFRVHSPAEDKLEIEVFEDESYIHNFKDKRGDSQIPAWKLGGNSVPLGDGEVVYESFFADAQAHWNLSIIHESDVLGAFTKHMNPQRVVYGDECNNQKVIEGILYKCRGGMLQSNKGDIETCDLCGGSGKYASSPYADHIVYKSKVDEMSTTGSFEPVSYVRVPTDATKLLSDRADAMVAKGNAAINMDIEDKVGENQSGIAKVYDRSAQNNTIFDIASRIFDVLMNNQFYFINKWMNGTEDRSAGKNTDDNLPQINKPTQFNIETVGELIEGYKASKESGIDRNVLQAKAIEIVNRDQETNPDRKKYYSAIIDLDPLFGFSQDELDANLAKGLIYKTDVVIHNNTKSFVDRALAERNDFLELPKMEKLVILKAYAEELIKSEKPKVEPMQPVEEFA